MLCGLLSACQGIAIHEARSDFSHIEIRDYGPKRAMLFVDADGGSTLETIIDRREPHRLQHPYSHSLMAGLLYLPEPANPSAGLLMGLGGGAVVHFLNREFPAMRLDVVEIDPVIVRLAGEYFGTVPGPRTRFLIEDAVDYVARTPESYDLVLMDVHLRPREGTDASGQPLRIKTPAFLRSLRERVRADGVAVFNLMEGPHTGADIQAIRAVFGHGTVFRSASQGNLIVVSQASGTRPDDLTLRRRARGLDRLGERGFRFESLLDERVD